jgi:hypothetical protein
VPVLRCGLALVGDPSRYTTAGRARLASVADLDDRVRCTVLGAGERVTITGCGDARTARSWTPGERWRDLDLVRQDDVWETQLDVPLAGWSMLEVSAAAR